MSRKGHRRPPKSSPAILGSQSGKALNSSRSSQSTLVSLAILKSQRDLGQDYLDLLRPFVLHVLCNDGLSVVNDASVADSIASHFGLVVPTRTTQLVLQRIVRDGGLARADGVYRRTNALAHTNLDSSAAAAHRHINALVAGLTSFAKSIGHEFSAEEEAIGAVCDFLSAFGVDSLRAILRGTTIPDSTKKKTDHYVVGAYIRSIQEGDPERFESLSVLVQGHMLANALVCPDLVNAPKTFDGLVFYFDTPLLVHALALEGAPRRDAALELFRLIAVLGGRMAAFEHVREELEGVVRGASDFVDSPKGRGRIVFEARRSGTTRSDLLLVAAGLDDELRKMSVEVLPTPPYQNSLQIDETAFADVLADEVAYYNERARQYDISSIRGIYVLRHGRAPRSLERAGAVLVTTNAALARAAYVYGRDHEESREVSSTITDFSLANLAWLKAPMQAPSLPTKELLSVAYAAMKPSAKLLDSFLKEAERLQVRGSISERDLQVLRSDLRAHDSLMALTLGDDEALSEETVASTLARVKAEILQEANDELSRESKQHDLTRNELAAANSALAAVSAKAKRRSRQWGRSIAWVVSTLAAVFILAGIAFGLGATAASTWLRIVFGVGAGLVGILTFANLVFGSTVKGIHRRLEQSTIAWFWKREQLRANLLLHDGANPEVRALPQADMTSRSTAPGEDAS